MVDEMESLKKKDKYRNLNVTDIKKKSCKDPTPIKYNLQFKYSTNLSGYEKNYFLYSGKEKKLNMMDYEKKKIGVGVGSLVQYIKKDDKFGKMAIVQKIIKTPSNLEAWQDNKRNPPKSPTLYEIKFLGLDINNPELESNRMTVQKKDLKLFNSYKKILCSDLVPNNVKKGLTSILEKYNKTSEKKYNNVIFDFNDKLTKDLLKKTSLMKMITGYYNQIFKDKTKKIFIPEYIYDDNTTKLIKPNKIYEYVLTNAHISKINIKNKKVKKKKIFIKMFII